jgi:hypothetical protein
MTSMEDIMQMQYVETNMQKGMYNTIQIMQQQTLRVMMMNVNVVVNVS